MATDYNKVKLQRTTAVNPEKDDIKKRDAIVKGKERKPGLFSRANVLFFGDDGIRGVTDHLVRDIFIQSIQTTISDVATNTINTISDVATTSIKRAIFGESYDDRRRNSNDYWYGSRRYVDNRMSSSRGRGYVDYSRQSEKALHHKSENLSNVVRVIEFDSANDANEVLSYMIDSVEQYGLVTVADFYELSDVASKFTDHQFGWTNLDGVRVIPIRGGGFYISFPPAVTV